MDLMLGLWQVLFFWPGRAFMDWLARTWPDLVIRHGFGFTGESYVFWVMATSIAFWATMVVLAVVIVRHVRRRRRRTLLPE